MAGEVFSLKARDTLAVLEVALENPDGSPHNLSGADRVWLHIRLRTGTVISREMTIDDAVGGEVSYAWQVSDWDLIPVPTYPAAQEHVMVYEVIAGTDRQTFPTEGHHRLVIWPDLEQGA